MANLKSIAETARSRADELRRIHEHLIREKDNKISATVNEFRITLQAKLGKEYDEQISSAGATASAAEAEAQTAEYAYAVSEPPVIPGTELVRWATGSWYHSPGTFLQDAIGIFEIVSFDSKFPENLSEYSRPKVGSYIVRLLKKDGTPSLKFDKYNHLGSNWLPKGKQPKGAVA